MFYAYMVNMYIRCIRLVCIFILQESVIVAAGMGYKAADKEKGQVEEFNSFRQGKFCNIMFATGASELAINWNLNVQRWLKNYVYMRLIDRNAKRGKFQVLPTLLTWVISMVWHGFYLAFSIAFVGTFVIAFAW